MPWRKREAEAEKRVWSDWELVPQYGRHERKVLLLCFSEGLP